MNDISNRLVDIMSDKKCSSAYALFLMDKEDSENVSTVPTAEIHTDEQRDNLGTGSRRS